MNPKKTAIETVADHQGWCLRGRTGGLQGEGAGRGMGRTAGGGEMGPGAGAGTVHPRAGCKRVRHSSLVAFSVLYRPDVY